MATQEILIADVVYRVDDDGTEHTTDIWYIIDGEYPDGEYTQKVRDLEHTFDGTTYLIKGNFPDGQYRKEVKEKGVVVYPKDKAMAIIETVDWPNFAMQDVKKCFKAILLLLKDIESGEEV